jgi:flagellar FliL protein
VTQANTPEAPKKKSRKGLIVIMAGVLVLAAGGGAAAYWRMRAPAAKPAAAEHRPTGEQGLLTLEPFIVNLADQGGSRFLRVSIRLIVASREHAERVQKDDVALTRVRSAILDLLTQQTADRLVTVEGKTALRQAIQTRVEPVLDETKVTDVLFSDFVVQF